MAEAVSEKSRGLTFAEQQMLRHGWQPGKGLGRHENGMSEPIKVKVKCDKGGVGHKLGDQFTFNWWDHVFNKASSNLSVEAGQDGITVKKVKDEEEKGMISNKRPLKANLSKRSMEYGCFVKSATLLRGEEQREQRASSSDDSSDCEDDDQKLDLSSATNLSDAELLKICGGRTAHKGARHGLTMSAKLARLEQQEQEFMAKYSKKATSVAPHTEANTDQTTQSPSNEDFVPKRTKRKKEKQKSCETEDVQDSVTNEEIDGPEISADGRKKKKKSSKEREDAETVESHVGGSVEDQNTEDTMSKKKKKKHSSSQKTEESNRKDSQEDFKDAITVSTEEPIAKHTVNTDLELQKALKKKKKNYLKKNLLEVENADNSVVVNGHHTDITNECDDSSEVIAEVKEQCTIDQVCLDLDSKKKKKKKKKCSKTKEDINPLGEEVTQKEETREEVPDVTGAEERTDGKSKAKKRKTGGDDERGIPDGDSSTMKKRKKGKMKAADL